MVINTAIPRALHVAKGCVSYIKAEATLLFHNDNTEDTFYLNVTNLESHEFVVWFWGPGVHLHSILQSNH